MDRLILNDTHIQASTSQDYLTLESLPEFF